MPAAGSSHAGCSTVQVQQHLDRMQQQKEAVAMDKLRVLMPQLGDVARALALAKSDWDIDLAVSMLRSFQAAYLDKWNTLNKVCHLIRRNSVKLLTCSSIVAMLTVWLT